MREPYPPHKRRGRRLRSGAALVVLLAVAGYLAVQNAAHGPAGPGCRVVSDRRDGRAYEFTPEQAVNAATISAVGTSRGLPERAVTIALATAIQESSLRNIRYGDRDSLGLFQQRPSQGWGTAEQIMDPAYAANQFYAHLVKVPGYLDLPLTQAAQRVQRSGFPDAYAKHEKYAGLLAAAFTGRSAATLTCQGRPAPSTAGGPDAVRAALARDFGRDVLQQAGAEVTPDQERAAEARTPGAAPSPASPTRPAGPYRAATGDPGTSGGTGTPSRTPTADTPLDTAADGDTADHTVTLPVPEVGGPDAGAPASGRRERGWQLAHWAVANASELHIERVTFAGREWRAGPGAARDGWRQLSGSGDRGAEGPQNPQEAVRIVTAPR